MLTIRWRPLPWSRLILWGLAVLTVLLLIPSIAAAAAVPATKLVFPTQQVWVLLIGALVPLVTYVLNHVGPWVTEPVKGFVTALVSAIATAIYTALGTNAFGFNNATLQLILTGIAATFAAHNLLWKPIGVNTLLGAGTNSPKVVAAAPAAQAAPPKA